MLSSRTHPAETTLVRALDSELSVAQRRALDRHLAACEPCRSRLTAFEAAARDAGCLCRNDVSDDEATTSVLRRRLHDRMTELGGEWDRSLVFRLRRAATSVPVFARVGLAVALFVLAVRLVQPDMSAVPPATRFESLPLSRFTPGAATDVSLRDLCSGSLPIRRVVSMAVRQDVLQKYQMAQVAPSEYELDYLITPELGGVGDARNLWPQRYESGVWNARVKDDLERLLPRLVCDGTVALGRAQREIAGDWIAAYKRHFNTDRPIPRQAGLGDDDDEILFETAPHAPATGWAIVSFKRPPVLVSAALTPDEAVFPARIRRLGW